MTIYKFHQSLSCCIQNEVIAEGYGHVWKFRYSFTENCDYSLD